MIHSNGCKKEKHTHIHSQTQLDDLGLKAIVKGNCAVAAGVGFDSNKDVKIAISTETRPTERFTTSDNRLDEGARH